MFLRVQTQTSSESIHPLSIQLILYRVTGVLDRRGTPWTGRQSVTGPSYRDRQPLTFTATGNLESPINLHVFGLWEEAGENPRRHEENMQTPHRRAPVGRWVWTQRGDSATAPPCRPPAVMYLLTSCVSQLISLLPLSHKNNSNSSLSLTVVPSSPWTHTL